MKFEFEIDDAEIAGIATPIAEQLVADPLKRGKLAEFALQQVIGWMSGRITHLSITEQQTAWLIELLPLFHGDQLPSAELIANSFAIPFGRAAYISRVLLQKQQTTWREQSRKSLLAALNAKAGEAQKNVVGGDTSKYVGVSLDHGAYRELTLLIQDILEHDPKLAPPINKATGLGRRTVDVPSQLFEPLIQRLNA